MRTTAPTQPITESNAIAETPTLRPRVAILLGSPLTEQNVERLGLHFLEPHCRIVVIDCARLIGRNPDAISIKKVDWPLYEVANTPEDLRRCLTTSGATWALDDIGLSVGTCWVWKLVKDLGIKLVYQRSGLLPAPSLKDRLRSFLTRNSDAANSELLDSAEAADSGSSKRGLLSRMGSLRRTLSNRLSYEWQYRVDIPTPDLVLLAGREALNSYHARKSAEKVWIGADDFYKYQAVARQLDQGDFSCREQPCALFIDVCLPYATDWKFLGIAPPITAEEYYPLLRRLLDRIELLLGVPVVVAGHPNTRWVPNYAGLVGGREVVLGSTAALVMQADLVLTHASTATSFIALAGKPSVFVSSRSIDRSYYGSRVRAMAESLASPLVMLEDATTLSDTMLPRAADMAACQRYVTRYLRSNKTMEQEPWQGFIDVITRHSFRVNQPLSAVPGARSAERQ